MTKKAHLLAGLLATLVIATFFISTIMVELFASQQAVAAVKYVIVVPGLFILLKMSGRFRVSKKIAS